jgi:acetylornithine deacetylase/succinyl-diaminopimelate desuccinylase-like protein
MTGIATRVIDLAIRIQQVPAPTFQEEARARLVQAALQAEGLEGVEIDEAGNVLACLRASKRTTQAPLVISAHLDTVFPGGTELTIFREGEKIFGPGLGDNSLGTAGLLGLLWLLRERRILLPFDTWLVANTCEEGLGDLRGMRHIVERFAGSVSAYLVLEGVALGHIFHRGLGVRRLRISIETEGGHSWIDHGKPSAVHELTRLCSRLTRLELTSSPRSTLNIGIIHGGTSVNTIAAQASLELDLRSEGAAELESLVLNVQATCQKFETEAVHVKVEEIGNRPAGEIPANHPLVVLAGESLHQQGFQAKLNIGSTDANIPLSLGLPAVTLGLTTGGGAHTVHEYIHTAPLEKGLESLLGVVTGLTQANGAE